MFRSAFLIAATAFAAFTSAAPLGDLPQLSQVGQVTNLPESSVLGRRTFNQAAGPVAVEVTTRGDECKTCDTLPGVFAFVDVKVEALLSTCKETVAAGPITVEVALKLIGEVKAIVVQLTALVAAVLKLNLDVNALLCLNGLVLSITACIDLIVKVVVNILLCLDVVVKACIAVKIDLTAVLQLVAEIVALVVALVKVILNIKVIANISVLLCVALKVALSVIVCIDIKALISVVAGIHL